MSPTAQTQALPSAELARELAGYALEKKAHDLLELDMRGLVGYTDFFLICSATPTAASTIHEGQRTRHLPAVKGRGAQGGRRTIWMCG